MKKKKQAKTVAKKKAAPKAAQKTSHTGVLPLGDRVLVKPLGPEELGTMTSFGIIIPDTAKEKPEQGTVVAVGPGKYDDGKLIPVSVKIGDRVLFSKYGFDEVKYAGTTYYILAEQNILAVIK